MAQKKKWKPISSTINCHLLICDFFTHLILISQPGSISVQMLSRDHQDSWNLFTPTWLCGNQTDEGSGGGQGSREEF